MLELISERLIARFGWPSAPPKYPPIERLAPSSCHGHAAKAAPVRVGHDERGSQVQVPAPLAAAESDGSPPPIRLPLPRWSDGRVPATNRVRHTPPICEPFISGNTNGELGFCETTRDERP